MFPTTTRRTLWATGAVTAAVGALVLLATELLLQRGDALARAVAADRATRAASFAATALEAQVEVARARLDDLANLLTERTVPLADLSRLMARGAEDRGNVALVQDDRVLASAQPFTLPPGLRPHPDPARPGLFLAGPVRLGAGAEPGLLLLRELPVGEATPMLLAAEIPNRRIVDALRPVQSPAAVRLRLEDRSGLVLAAAEGQEALIGGRLLPPVADPEDGSAALRKDRQGGATGHAARQRLAFQDLAAVAFLPDAEGMGSWLRFRDLLRATGWGLAGLAALFGALAAVATHHHRRAREAEAEGRRRLEAAVAAMQDGFALWDAGDRLVMCNERLRRLYEAHAHLLVPGVRFEEVLDGALLSVPADRRASLRAQWMGLHRMVGPPFERRLMDGNWVRIALGRMPDGGMVAIHTDVTAQRRMIDDLAEARDAVARAMQAKSRLLSHVSHELRTPLASLLRLAEALRDDPALGAAARRRVEMVSAAGRHLLALSNEVLDLAALEAGKLALREEPVAAMAPVEDAAAIIRPVAEAARVRVEVRTEGLPPALRCDATRLRQVLLNLLGNAVKFSPPGGLVTLEARRAGDGLVLSVSDQGPGVPPERREALFEDFTRLSSSSAVEGTGLGLAITSRLVALMGGSIACLDGPGGRGTSFRVELPLAEAELPAPAPAPPRPKAALRVLAVDDSPANLAVLRAQLSGSGLGLATATGGEAALAALQRAEAEGAPFDVVLMDVMMPGMDGLEATRRLRALPGTVARTPVVAVTAGAFPEDIAATEAAGMDGHVSKPVSRGALLEAIAAARSGRGATEAA